LLQLSNPKPFGLSPRLKNIKIIISSVKVFRWVYYSKWNLRISWFHEIIWYSHCM